MLGKEESQGPLPSRREKGNKLKERDGISDGSFEENKDGVVYDKDGWDSTLTR